MHNNDCEGECRARRVVQIWVAKGFPHIEENQEEIIRHMQYTRKPCSCPMCGNPRHHFGQPTVQEQRAEMAAAADMELAQEMGLL